ncbi:MAG: hypothetical protein ABEK03_03810 [Candidatus Bipolaricaulia bacterium]
MIRSSSEMVLSNRLRAAVLLVLAVGLAACAGGSEVSEPRRGGSDLALIASQFVPRTSTVEHSPDSLVAVSIRADSGEVTLQQPYPSLLRQWATGKRYKNTPSRSHQPFRSILGGQRGADVDLFSQDPGPQRLFAVLRSKDLFLGALARRPVDSLSTDTFRKRLHQRADVFRDTLRVDVYFLNGPLQLSQQVRVELQDNSDRVYSPVDRSSQIGRATVHGRSFRYLRASYYFDRSAKEGGDLIENTSSLRLRMYRPRQESLYFEWQWERARLSER